jgi:2-methylcitrate dehydratase PrpD
MSALEQLGAFVATGPAGALTGGARETVELHLIDTIGAWIAASATTEGRALFAYRAAMAPQGDALALDLATRCALARLSEIDDIHLPSMTTPGSIVIPGALTIAAALPDRRPDDLIAAVLAGYEVMTRFGRAIDGPRILYRGIWPTYFAAPLPLPPPPPRLFGLDQRQAAHALALALTFAAPGVGHHNAATTARWFAVGNAARNGLVTARAAQMGFTADLSLIDGNFLPSIYDIAPNPAALTDELGESPALRDVSFKPWCAARQTMAATQALKEIVESGVAPDTMTEIRAFVLPPHLKMIDHGVIAGDRASHLTSVQYCMAAAAAAPELAFDVSAAAPSLPVPVRALMDKIKVEADESLRAGYPRVWPARVCISADGVPHERTVTHVPGDPAQPFDRARVREKFLRFTRPILGAQKADKVLTRCSQAFAAGQFASLIAEIEEACVHAANRTSA